MDYYLIAEYAGIGLVAVSIVAGAMIGIVGMINKPYKPQEH